LFLITPSNDAMIPDLHYKGLVLMNEWESSIINSDVEERLSPEENSKQRAKPTEREDDGDK